MNNIQFKKGVWELCVLTSIDINAISSDVSVIPDDGNEIKIRFYGQAATTEEDNLPKLVVSEAGKSLIVKIKHPSKINIGFNYRNCKLDVYVPTSLIKELDIKSASGDIEASQIELDSFNAVSVSGDLDIDRLKASNTRLKTTSGDMSIDSFIGKLDLDTTSGDIESTILQARKS